MLKLPTSHERMSRSDLGCTYDMGVYVYQVTETATIDVLDAKRRNLWQKI